MSTRLARRGVVAGVFDWRRWLIYTHRWLGIGGGVLFVTWFVSGVVLMYAGMPSLSEEKRLRQLPPLDLSRATVSPADAAAAVGANPQRLMIAMVGERPVDRFPHAGRWTTVYADTGNHFEGLTPAQAVEMVNQFAPAHASTAQYDRTLTEPDQWSIQSGPFRPLHRIALGDQRGTYVYVSDRTGLPMLETTASGRRWAYAGAVLHWLYFTPFRQHAGVWLQSVIWLSILGCVITLTGLVWDLWRVSPRRRYRLRRESHSMTPYSELMKWHHYAGLIFGFVTFTWVLSGCLLARSLRLASWDDANT